VLPEHGDFPGGYLGTTDIRLQEAVFSQFALQRRRTAWEARIQATARMASYSERRYKAPMKVRL
jgi:hypothetical protein